RSPSSGKASTPLAHPNGVEAFPDEGLRAEARPFKLYATRGLHAPVTAQDDRGRDVSAVIANLDHEAVRGFELTTIRGFAREHGLTIDVGTGARRLLLTGWTE